jgi:PAS domain S-box-containing protein
MSERTRLPYLSRSLELGWEHARDAMFLADIQSGLLVDVNPAAERLMGYDRTELIGMHQSRLHPEDERSGIQEAFRRTAASSTLVPGFHVQMKDGRCVPIEISSSDPFHAGDRLLVLGIFRDVSELEERETRLQTKRWALQAYAAAALALARANSSAGLMQAICEAITDDSIFKLAWVGFDSGGEDKLLHTAGAAGPAIHYMDGLQVSWSDETPSGRGPTGTSFRTNAVVTLEDTETDESFEPWREKARREGLRSSITAPFAVGDGRRGILAVYASQPHAFGPVVTEAFTHLAEEIGLGLYSLEQEERLSAERLERERAQEELAWALSAVVSAITTAFEMRDPYTAGHQNRVAEIACAIAKELGWSDGRLQAMRVTCMVHDIGKISIPYEILTKSTPPTAEDWAVIKQHPETGYQILKDVPFPFPIAEGIRQHHERLDGSGYPRGLKGDEILPGSRILAVADMVEAMASNRPYRPGLGLEAALKEIESQAGTLLDAEVVRTCVRLFREKGLVLPGLNLP